VETPSFYLTALLWCAGGVWLAIVDLYRTGAIIPSLYQQDVMKGVRFHRIVFAYLFNVLCATVAVAIFFSPSTMPRWAVAAIAAVVIASDKGWSRLSAEQALNRKRRTDQHQPAKGDH
jgi:hypothetical protein